MLNLKKITSLLSFMFIFLVPASGMSEEIANINSMPLEKVSVSAYTKAFAKRFGLPEPHQEFELKFDLQAIEFSLEKSEFAPLYFGVFKLYLPQSLSIAYPEESVAGEKDMLIRGTHFFGGTHDSTEQWLRWPVNDRIHFNSRQGKYNRKAYFASINYIPGKSGLVLDLSYAEYHQDLIPGISYVKLYTSTSMFPDSNRKGPFSIWLEKKGGPDYEKLRQIDPNDFLKFELPEQFFKQASQAIKMTESKNRLIR